MGAGGGRKRNWFGLAAGHWSESRRGLTETFGLEAVEIAGSRTNSSIAWLQLHERFLYFGGRLSVLIPPSNPPPAKIVC